MEEDIDSKKINQLLKISNLVLKNINLLILLVIIYIGLIIINKLHIFSSLLVLIKLLSPLFIGIVTSWLLRPIVNYLVSKNMNKIFAVVTLYILIIFFIYISLITFIPIFIKELIEFINKIPELINIVTESFKFIKIDGFTDNMISSISNIALSTTKDIPIRCISIIKSISSILIGLIIGFYLLIENINIRFKKIIKKDTYIFIKKTNSILRNYVKGTLLSALIVFIFSTILFYILGLESPLLFGLICGVTNIIPFIGPYIGGAVPVLVAFTKRTTFGIIVVVVIFIIQTIEGNIINPIIMKKSVNVHPVVSIISLLVFGYLFGIIGMVLAVPIVAIIKELYFYLLKKHKRKC